ncbi:MAG: sigma-70 family RNA polymerase sigma factor [Acidimicrobiales bacterium]|nr:sigma-70 family RNA polymerase sigma factor [Acidimicrobiales bacterium]
MTRRAGQFAEAGDESSSSHLSALVEAARHGDRTAFDALVRSTYVDTYTLAHRLTGDAEDARDVVQETYLRAFRAIGRFRGDAKFTTWLYRITANCASNHLGRRRRHRHDELTDDMAVGDPHPSRDPVGRAENELLRDRLHVALQALPPRLRAVVVLRDVYDLPHEAIAVELGISESAAKVRLHRARRKLRDVVALRDLSDGEGSRAV